MKCPEVQQRLTDYMARETEPGVTESIRAHLESCQDCRSIVRELTDTVEILLEDSRLPRPEMRCLTETRRARIRRAVRHPVLHWLESHLTPISLLIGVILVGLAAAAANYISRERKPVPQVESGTVTIWEGPLPPPATNPAPLPPAGAPPQGPRP
jgi:predicted anti-sigma-YlaC factor YlaD